MALESTDNLKDMPHIVVLKTTSGAQVFEYEGPGCMVAANAFAMKLAIERPDSQVLVAMQYRTITGPDALHMLD